MLNPLVPAGDPCRDLAALQACPWSQTSQNGGREVKAKGRDAANQGLGVLWIRAGMAPSVLDTDRKFLFVAAAIAALWLGLAAVPRAEAALNLSGFSVTPSTTRAGAHPSLNVSISFSPPTADVKGIALHLPAGLTANAGAAPFCSRGRLVSDLCPLETKVGSVSLVGVALGFEAEAVRNIYNVKPVGAEPLRLGVPVFGTASRGGVALILLVTRRPEDNGLDIAVAGPPREVAGYSIGIKSVGFRIRGTVRRRVKGSVRRRAFLTNPSSCRPATSALGVTAYEGPPAEVTSTSTFTPTGC
jgi:hypothetical protein